MNKTVNKQRFVVFSSCIGSCLEAYDLILFISFIDLILKEFFYSSVEGQQTAYSLVFAVSYLARPIGGALFGLIGDTEGRKKSVMLSMIFMAFPSLVISIMPSYEQIGWLQDLFFV